MPSSHLPFHVTKVDSHLNQLPVSNEGRGFFKQLCFQICQSGHGVGEKQVSGLVLEGETAHAEKRRRRSKRKDAIERESIPDETMAIL